MFFRDLKLKKGMTLKVTLATVHLPVRLGHRDVEKTFIDPLGQQMAAAGLGTIAGFDVRNRTEAGIAGLDIHLAMTDAARPALETVARMLEHLRAPYGSSIRRTDMPGDPILFGATEGLELSIGTDAAPDAEARKDLAQTCRSAIEDQAVSRGWIRQANRTSFYFYGESFAEMKERLTRVLDDDPRFSSAILRRLA